LPRCLEREKAHPQLCQPFDEAVTLLDEVVELFDWSQCTGFGEDSFFFYLVEGFGARLVFIDGDHARRNSIGAASVLEKKETRLLASQRGRNLDC
jgi:hypothetical protein